MKRSTLAVLLAAGLALSGATAVVMTTDDAQAETVVQDPKPTTHIKLDGPAPVATDAGVPEDAGAATDGGPDDLTGIGTSPSAAAAPPTDAGGLATELYRALQRGKNLPAIGLSMMLLALGLRSSIGKMVPWFMTKPGGYVVGFGSTTMTYAGTALAAGQPVTLGLFTSGIGAGFVASGGWEALRDFVVWAKSKAS